MTHVVGKVFDANNDLIQKRTEVTLSIDESRGNLTLDYENTQRISTTFGYRLILEDGREGAIVFNRMLPSMLASAVATFVVIAPFSLPEN